MTHNACVHSNRSGAFASAFFLSYCASAHELRACRPSSVLHRIHTPRFAVPIVPAAILLRVAGHEPSVRTPRNIHASEDANDRNRESTPHRGMDAQQQLRAWATAVPREFRDQYEFVPPQEQTATLQGIHRSECSSSYIAPPLVRHLR